MVSQRAYAYRPLLIRGLFCLLYWQYKEEIFRHMNGQETYKKLLNNFISPALRKRGFKGTSGVYELSNPGAYVQIGFQKNKWNAQQDVSFTVNISVIDKKVWEEARKRKTWLDSKPSANTSYPVKMWMSRLGNIPLLGHDKWWKLHSDSNVEVIAIDIISRIDKHALPAINKQLSKIQVQ